MRVLIQGGEFDTLTPEQFRQRHKPEEAKLSSFHELLKEKSMYIVEADRKYSSKLKSLDE